MEQYQKYCSIGECSHCGLLTEVVPVKRVASKFFTNWDSYSNNDIPLWCNVCVWSFTEATNRSEALLITDKSVISCYQVQSLQELMNDPFDEYKAFSVALKKAKHVLPYAQWGNVTIEDVSFAWTSRETKWLNSFHYLVNAGFSLNDIKKYDSPSPLVIAKMERGNVADVYSQWSEITKLKKLPHIYNFISDLNKNSTMQYTIH